MINRVTQILLITLTIMFAPPSYAIVCTSTPPLDMGAFARLDNQTGTYAVDEYGGITNSNNIRTINQPTAGVYYCVENVNGNNGYYWPQAPTCTSAITPSGCSATATITFADPAGVGGQYNFNMKSGDIRSIPYGISLTISPGCLPGTYYSSCTPTLFSNNGRPASNATLGPIDFSFGVVPYLSVSEIVPLNFGVLGSTSSAGQATVTHAGVRSGTAVLINSAPYATAGELQISGTPSTSFSVLLPTTVTLQHTNTNIGATLTVGNFVPSTGTLTGLATDSLGTATIFLGGTLSVPANAPNGTYNGDYTVTVSY